MSSYPCLLVGQVDQFKRREEPSQYCVKDPCRLVRQANQFRAKARNLRSCQINWQGAGDVGFSLLAVQTDVPATQAGRGETKNVDKDNLVRVRGQKSHDFHYRRTQIGRGVDANYEVRSLFDQDYLSIVYLGCTAQMP